ncbi:YhdP family protein [Xylophilus sp.]|uniref:YhdP family protein n=1 Tax=Xylophilus sp. TaxID=2653893 RepID=UPI002D7FF37B|nr:YhdP family protein [Xylophilus sp.]
MSPAPTRLLRATATVVRWAWWLLLTAWLVLFAAWGAIHGWIVPRIDEFRPRIEAQAARLLGIPVRIGAVHARTESFVPTFEFSDVVLSDPSGREALRLPRVVASLSPRSLWHRGFEQLYLEAPVLDVRRTAAGELVVAGLTLGDRHGEDSAFADWLFAQTEVVVRGGALRWTDEQRGAVPLALSDVDILVRRRGWRHELRIDATPPADWGRRFTIMGRLRQPLLTTHAGRWRDWSGQLYAECAQVDVSQLRRHADLGQVEVMQGHGAVRAWADLRQGTIVGGAADVSLAGVQARLGATLEPLALQSVSGRAGGRRHDGGFEFSTTGLQFITGDGVHWPGGNLSVRYTDGGPHGEALGELKADRLDLGALAGIAARLPLGDALHDALRIHAPAGRIEEVHARWQGPLDALTKYQAKGRATGLSLAAVPAPDGSPPDRAGTPGLRGAAVDFDLTQAGGTAELRIARGSMTFPGVFEEAEVPLDRLAASLQWQLDGPRIRVQVPQLSFANADAAGTARATWHTSDPGSPRGRFPGVLDLTGTLSHAEATRVHRYLPLHIHDEVRHYVRDAVRAGRSGNVSFRVRGELDEVPFRAPHKGEFRIAAQLHGVDFAYLPPGRQRADEPPWPALAQLDAELVFEHNGMRVNGASGHFADMPELRVVRADARIPDLHASVLSVDAQAQGPAGQLLAMLAHSPVSRLTGHALDRATATGAAGYRLQLSVPFAHAQDTKVNGSVVFAGNDLRITPASPLLGRTRGRLDFNDAGFTLAGVQARAYGGDVRIEGGLRHAPPAGEPGLLLRAQGTATAEGLRQASELGAVARLARSARGGAAYAATISMRRGEPEVQATSNLAGLALDLPAPFGKPADTSLALRFDKALLREAAYSGPLRDQIRLDLDGVATVAYERDLADDTPRVLRGSIAVGLPAGETVAPPAAGVQADVRLGEADLDAWQEAFSPATSGAAPAASQGGADAAGYLPTRFALRAGQLRFHGRTLHDVAARGTHDGGAWRVNADARELAGDIEYRMAGNDATHVHARLKRLAIPQAATGEVESLVDERGRQPASLPSLDVVVDDFSLRGLSLGRLQIEAQQRGGTASSQREWTLSKLDVSNADSHLSASGSWAARRTALDLKLDVRDAGALLARMGWAGTVRGGRGSLEGSLAWHGSPISLDYPSLAGRLHLDMAAGQFLKAEPGLAKLLGVLSLQSLPRRLTLDFRDVFSEGFAFDYVRGDARIERGIVASDNLQMKGVSAAVLMEGQADLGRETQDLRVVVVPEINAGTASLVASVVNPAVGLGTFLAQLVLRGPLIAATTREFRIQGTWSDPQVTRVQRGAASRSSAGGEAAASSRPSQSTSTH